MLRALRGPSAMFRRGEPLALMPFAYVAEGFQPSGSGSGLGLMGSRLGFAGEKDKGREELSSRPFHATVAWTQPRA